MQTSFRFSIRNVGLDVLETHYEGHMGEFDLEHLNQLRAKLSSATAPYGMVFVVPKFTSFHRSQVLKHGELFLSFASRIAGIAVVQANPVVRFGSVTVGLMSRLMLKTFDSVEAGHEWVASLHKEARVHARV